MGRLASYHHIYGPVCDDAEIFGCGDGEGDAGEGRWSAGLGLLHHYFGGVGADYAREGGGEFAGYETMTAA